MIVNWLTSTKQFIKGSSDFIIPKYKYNQKIYVFVDMEQKIARKIDENTKIKEALINGYELVNNEYIAYYLDDGWFGYGAWGNIRPRVLEEDIFIDVKQAKNVLRDYFKNKIECIEKTKEE